MANPDLLGSLHLFHDAEARVLICTRDQCKFALSTGPSRVTTHLRDKHNIPSEARKGLSRLLKSLPPPGLLDPEEAPPRADRSAEHDKLRVYEGFACVHCVFRTINLQLMRRHLSDPPDDCSFQNTQSRIRRRRDLDQQFECVYLQTWTTGSTRKYWIIQRGGSVIRPLDGPAVQSHLRAVLTRELGRQQRPPAPEPGRSPRLARRPDTDLYFPGGREYVLGCPEGIDEDLVSPGRDEDLIAFFLCLADVMLDRCEETVRNTSRHILCWLKSTQTSSIYSKPFTLVQLPSSSAKYRLILKRCLAMVFRLYRMAPDMRMRAAGLSLSRKQMQFLDAMWAHEAAGDSAGLKKLAGKYRSPIRRGQAATGDERGGDEEDECGVEYDDGAEGEQDDEDDDEEGDDSLDEDRGFTTGSPEELVELLFGLTLALATQPVIDGQPQTTVLIYFSGILGFSSSPDSVFLPARSYTSNLSAMIYILRLVFLEYALPLRPYHALALQRRPRVGQLDRLQPIRRQYMVMESESPLEELLSLRNFGYVMSRTDAPPHFLRWSDEGQVVSMGDEISISMGRFRRLPEHFIKEAAKLCDEMMFSWDPAIDLSNIKDDMTNNKEGFSFVLHPANKLDEAYLRLCNRASRAHRSGLVRGAGWDWEAVCLYFKKEEALLCALLGGMFCSGGQLPRCTEVLSLLCSNGELHPRSIYVYDRSMLYITRHHKAKRTTNREFIVARFLPAQLGHILYKYLVYVRPFIHLLHRERGIYLLDKASGTPLLFREDVGLTSRPWQTGRLTAILRGATSTVWGQSVNSRQFRQMCIGITEKHVRDVHQPFNRFDDRTASASRNVVFAWQSGHRPLQRGTTYGLDGASPTKLQPQLLELYRWASSRWHEFLHLPSYLAHVPVAHDPFKRNDPSSPLVGSQDEDGDNGGGVATSLTVSPVLIPSDKSSSPVAADNTTCHPPTRPCIFWSSSSSTAGRSTEQRRQDSAVFLDRINAESEQALERQDQAARDERIRHGTSAKRSRRQADGSDDTAPHPKRSRTLPSSFRSQYMRDQSLNDDDWSHRPLFGYPGDIATSSAMVTRMAILDHLGTRVGFSDDKNLLRANLKLWTLGEQLEKWCTVGCQLCYVCGDQCVQQPSKAKIGPLT
ncbi:hypothetical protein MRS44_017648 [Fusarium solani]|uniref:uncharacterized protein n=1 Tax=Fusarium solani TaxID=169388 RepID=UPI0032C43353|nr:hypothetical protein MRS44_017648 [Fusarium solani]